MTDSIQVDKYIGCLLGIAAGDSLGLPYEGLSTKRGDRLFPDRSKHHFLLGKGMVSDDTEHACFTARAMIKSQNDPQRFARKLAWSLRFWLLGLPAGVGMATGRAILKLWLGFPPNYSGVYSAGNGPAMRSPLIGVKYGHNPELLKQFVNASTRLTHTDPKAYHGSLAIALAAHMNAETTGAVDPDSYLLELGKKLIEENPDELLELIRNAKSSAENGESVGQFAQSIGSKNGISGYMYHTVPCILQVWFRFGKDFKGGIKEIIAAGGDADTTAAILGGIIGAGVGKDSIPKPWLDDIIEYPRSVSWMEKLACSLATSKETKNNLPGYCRLAIPFRNLMFFAIVMTHGFRRLLPPY